MGVSNQFRLKQNYFKHSESSNIYESLSLKLYAAKRVTNWNKLLRPDVTAAANGVKDGL